MPYVIITAVWPTYKAEEVGNRYLEVVKKSPLDNSLATEIVPGAFTRTLQGVKGTVIYETKAEKYQGAMNWARERCQMFRDIQGYEFIVEGGATIQEAFAASGMNPPA
jgi:hypothetical protein